LPCPSVPLPRAFTCLPLIHPLHRRYGQGEHRRGAGRGGAAPRPSREISRVDSHAQRARSAPSNPAAAGGDAEVESSRGGVAPAAPLWCAGRGEPPNSFEKMAKGSAPSLRSVWTSGQGTWNDRDQRVCIDSGASRQYLSPMHACLIHGDRSQQPDLPPSLSLSLSLRGERDRGNVIMAILYSKKHRSVAMYNAGHLLRRQTDEMGREYDDFALRLRMRSGRFFV